MGTLSGWGQGKMPHFPPVGGPDYISEGSVSHINGVWTVFILNSYVHSFAHLQWKVKTHNQTHKSVFVSVVYLRKKYQEQLLSEEATALLLNSWRTKTNKSYDFGK